MSSQTNLPRPEMNLLQRNPLDCKAHRSMQCGRDGGHEIMMLVLLLCISLPNAKIGMD